jgi:hypothetical protein
MSLDLGFILPIKILSSKKVSCKNQKIVTPPNLSLDVEVVLPWLTIYIPENVLKNFSI